MHDIQQSVTNYKNSFIKLFFKEQFNSYYFDLSQILFRQESLVIHPKNAPVVIKYNKQIFYKHGEGHPDWAMESYARPIHPSLVNELCVLIKNYQPLLEGQKIIHSFLVRWFTFLKRTNLNLSVSLCFPAGLADLANITQSSIPTYSELRDWYEMEKDTFGYFTLLLMKNKLLED